MDELIEVHGRLLTLERECELERASSDVLLLQRRDARLVVERIDRSSGLGGRVTVAMKRRSDLPLALGRIGVGDVVAIRPVAPLESAANASTLPRGVVAKLSDLSVSVVLDDSEHDDSDSAFVVAENASVFLVRLANDVTYTRLREALAELPSMRQSRVARVCFGETEPHQLGERDSELRVLDAGLNASQIDAVRFALASSDVAVIHGPPGTGKTTTVVELVRQLVLRRRRVLVCAPSNTAVDNLLAKLAPCMMRGELKLSRVGHAARVSEALLPFSLDNAVLQSDDMGLARDIRADIARVNARLTTARGGERRALNGELRALRSDVRKRERLAKARTLASCDVVLATCVGAGSRGFRAAAASATVHDGVVAAATTAHERKPFDVVIIDEAAQALELSCWIPIALGSRVVLAGDHLQLPPTIFSEEAARGGLSTTLVDRVVKRWGDRCTRLLSTQYRMHENIMSYSNQALYESKLVADESVRLHKLADLDGMAPTDEFDEDDDSYEAHAIDELLLIDTDGCEMYEAVESANDDAVAGEDEESKSNAGEVEVVAQHIELLVSSGLSPAAIGVLSPYNGQVRLLKERLLAKFPAIEIGSVDGFQGREKEAIVISFVRSNTNGVVGFLSDDRRTNVAITRARRHLALIGDSRTLSSHPFLKRLVAFVHERGHVHSAAELSVGDEWSARGTVVVPKSKDKRRDKPKKQSATAAAEAEERNEKIRSDITARIVAFLSSSGADDELRLPATLTSFERMVAHEVAERRGLVHKSEGQGKERQIVIRRQQQEIAPAPASNYDNFDNNDADENEDDQEDEKDEDEDDEQQQDEDEDEVQDDDNDDNDADDDVDDDDDDDNGNVISDDNDAVTTTAATTTTATATTATTSVQKKIAPVTKPLTKSRHPTKPNIPGAPTRYQTTNQALDAAIAANNRCAMLNCRADVQMFSMICEFCKQTYCTSHAIAFVHGCRDAARKKRQAEVDEKLKHLKNNTKPMTNLKPVEHARMEAKMSRVLAEKKAARTVKATKAEAGRGASSGPSGPASRGRGRGRGRG